MKTSNLKKYHCGKIIWLLRIKKKRKKKKVKTLCTLQELNKYRGQNGGQVSRKGVIQIIHHLIMPALNSSQ